MVSFTSALQLKHYLDNSKVEIRWGSPIVRVDGLKNRIPLNAFSKRLVELSKILPFEEEKDSLKERLVALHALERLRIHYKWSDALLKAHCFSRMLARCQSRCCKNEEVSARDLEIVHRKFRGFTEAHFRRVFPGRGLPLNSLSDGETLYLVEQEDLEALVQPPKEKSPPKKKSHGWWLFKKLSR